MTVLTVLFCAATPAAAATPSEFYLSLLHRGIVAFENERYSEATSQLKLAAFGLLDSIENYQTAQVYLTLSYDRLNDPVKARDAARRVVLAERIQRKFATIGLPANVAKSFDGAVTKLLGNTDAAYLRGPTQNAEPSAPQPGTKPRQTTSGASAATQSPQPSAVVEKGPEKAPAEKVPEPAHADPPNKPPVGKPVATAPRGEAQETSSRSASVSQPIVPPPAPAPAPSPAPARLTAKEAAARLVMGERALSTGQLAEARRTYHSLLDAAGVARDTLIRVAEGLYRARDFEGTLAAFAKAGSLHRGEEPYHYYLAVAYYETGQYARAKTELAAAIPFIEVTPDVARYRTKIDEAAN